MASIGSQFAPRVALERTVSAIASARRAALADRYAISSFAAEWRPLSELGGIEDEWRDLAAHALEPNVFYEPAFALAAAPVFGRDAGAVLVWSGTEPRKLLGFFPARVNARRYGVKFPVLIGWTHPYAPLGTPLVERDAAEPVIAAWLAHLAARSVAARIDAAAAACRGRARSRRRSKPFSAAGRCRMPISRAISGRCSSRAGIAGITSTMRSQRTAEGTAPHRAALGGSGRARCSPQPRSRPASPRRSTIFSRLRPAAGRAKPARGGHPRQ